MLEYLTKERFFEVSSSIPGGHWSRNVSELRWQYHAQAIDVVKTLGIEAPERVLEIGTMGVSLVNGSHTMDYAEKWDFPGKQPTYLHDARRTPWPIPAKSYDVVIALRVFQHLAPVQRVCFLEAKRIAKCVLLICPERYQTEQNPSSRGIQLNQFVQWNENTPPTRSQFMEMGVLHFWDEKSLPPETNRMVRFRSRVLYDAYRATTCVKRIAKRSLKTLLGYR